MLDSSLNRCINVKDLNGIFLFQLARRHLSGQELKNISIIQEGFIIYDEIMMASTFSSQCGKCGYKISPKDLVICHESKCSPIRMFHNKCINGDRLNFVCALCDPSKRDDFCFKTNCEERFDNNSLECRHPGCRRFIHRNCLSSGDQYVTWDCGICTVAVI